MRICFIDEESLLTLKSNLPDLANKFYSDSNSWIENLFEKSPYVATKFPEVADFSLDMSDPDPFKTEARNAELVYEHLKFLSDSQASDERLWAALCLKDFWPYVQYRWKIKEKCTASNIKQHFFFDGSSRRALTRNALARLWWIGRLTYDETNADHYRLTRYLCRHADNIMNVLERNTSNSKMITRAFLTALIDAEEKENLLVNTDMVGALSKYLNLLGGTYILDCLPEDVIYQKILNKVKELTEVKRKAEEEKAKAAPEKISVDKKRKPSLLDRIRKKK